MNSFTLKFVDSDQESYYKTSRKIVQIQSLSQSKLLFIILLILQITDEALKQQWIELIYNTTSIVILILTHIFRNSIQEVNEICIFLVVLIYNIQQPINFLIGGSIKDSYFSDGYFVSLSTFGVISNLDFIKKIVIVNIIVAVHIVSKINFDYTWRQLVIYMISDLILLFYFYISEKEQRLTYIGIKNKGLIEESLYREMDISSYIVHYDNQSNSFNLIGQNQFKEVNEETQLNFIKQIRKMRVMVGNQGSRHQELYSQEQLNIGRKLNLEQFLFYLFTNEEKLQFLIYKRPKTTLYELIGLIGSDIHHIKLIKTFDTQPCVIILIKENKKESQKQQLKQKLKIANKLIDQAQQTVQQQLRVCLICLKWLINQNGANLKSIQKFDNIQRLVKFINSKGTKAYNDICNICDFHDINGKFNKIEMIHFNIHSVIEECAGIVRLYNQKTRLMIRIASKIKNKMIFSDQKKIKQLILNCLFFLIKVSNDVRIELVEENGELNEMFIKISFCFKGQAFSKDRLDSLPILNPQSIEELKHNNNKQLELELPIILMIVRQLGPYNQIKYKQGHKEQQSFIEFYLFTELEDYALNPIVSLHPQQNLITSQKFIKKQSQTYKNLDLTNKSLDANLNTFRNQNDQMVTKL